MSATRSPSAAVPGAFTPLVPDQPWHTLDASDVERLLRTPPTGLGAAEAARRLREVGANEVASETRTSWLALAIGQLRDPLIYILIAAAGVTLALRDTSDTIVILAVVVINGAIGLVQEHRAREAMQSLSRLSAPRAVVVRDGSQSEVPTRELVPGDVVVLASGARVPADIRLIDARDLFADESLLTGESDAIAKTVVPLPDPTLVPADQTNVAFAGTIIARGRGRGVVVRTGARTELGQIADTMRAIGRAPTPLEEAFARFGRRVGVAIVALALLTVVLGLARGIAVSEIFLTAVALAVSAMPEGLPVVLTITLAVGVRRMARRHAIIRSLPAVETLGSTTVIGSDKTGTLTRNEMTVRAISAGGASYDVTGTGYAPTGMIVRDGRQVLAADAPAVAATLRGAVLASEIDAAAVEAGHVSGDPTEIALVVAAIEGGIAVRSLAHDHPEIDVLPFESERQLMISLRRDAPERGDALTEYLKGAPEAVLRRCERELGPDGAARPLDRGAAMAAATEMAQRGLRVLAVALRPTREHRIVDAPHESGFTLAGLVGMQDPVRDAAAAAVADAHSAGIRVLMLTGDHVGTARAVGRTLGLGDAALPGHEVALLSDEDLDLALREVNVFARVTPEHKLRIVQRLEAHGEVVAVTGDGVNDAPALRAAHLGIAMGASGSDVAREAAGMVRADDDFATITAAVEEGRIVFANIRKVTFFLLSTAAGEVFAILTTLAAGWPLPFTAAQILWINLVTDSLQVMALSFEPGEPGLLARPPRPRDEGVLTRRHFVRLAAVGIVLVVPTLATFWWTLRTTGDMTRARTVALTQMVVLQFYHVFNCRSLDRSVFTIAPLSNPYLFASMVAVALAHLAALYTPLLQRLLHTVPLTGSEWGVILIAGLVVIAGGEGDKLVNRLTRRSIG